MESSSTAFQSGYRQPSSTVGTDLEPDFAAVADDEAFARLKYVIENRRQTACVCGPPGSGKSSLLGRLSDWIKHSQREVVFLDGSSAALDRWKSRIADQLRFWPNADAGPFAFWRDVEDELTGRHSSGIETVFLIDHLNGSSIGLNFLERITEFRDRVRDSHITIVAAVRSISSDRRLLSCLRPGLRIDLKPAIRA